MATRKRKKEDAGGVAAAEPPAEPRVEQQVQRVEQPVQRVERPVQPVEQPVEQPVQPVEQPVEQAVEQPVQPVETRDDLEKLSNARLLRNVSLRKELDEEKLKVDHLLNEVHEQKQKVERLRGSWCIWSLNADQLQQLQRELQQAMERVKDQLERRACESTLCEKIPEAVCPITRKIMLNPVIAADAHTYERPAIKGLIALHKGETKSPVTGELLAHHDLNINWYLRGVIDDTQQEELERKHGRGYIKDMRDAWAQLLPPREDGVARKEGAACSCPEQEQGAASGKCAKD
jgi:hypothetical protein